MSSQCRSFKGCVITLAGFFTVVDVSGSSLSSLKALVPPAFIMLSSSFSWSSSLGVC